MKLKDKVVFLTGASSGIGEALAIELNQRGYKTILAARRIDRLEKLASEFNQNSQNSVAVQCDVTSDESVQNAYSIALKTFGKLDVVIANAGFGVVGNLEKLSVDDYQRQFETNVFGMIRTIKPAIEELKKTKGQVIVVGSVMGYLSIAGQSAYSMSKYAVRALAEAIEYELKPYGIAVTQINPGYVQSEIRRVDNKGKFHPESKRGFTKLHMPANKAAKIIANSLDCRCREILVTNHAKVIVFIAKHLPWLIRLAMRYGLRGREKVI